MFPDALSLLNRWLFLWVVSLVAVGTLNAGAISDRRNVGAGGVTVDAFLEVSNLRFHATLGRWVVTVRGTTQYKSGTATVSTTCGLAVSYLGVQLTPTANYVVQSGQTTAGNRSATADYILPVGTTEAMAIAGLSFSFNSYPAGTAIVKVLTGGLAPTSQGDGKKTSGPQFIKNTFTDILEVEYKDRVTGQTLVKYTLKPGEELYYTIKSSTGNPVDEILTLPNGGYGKNPDDDTQWFIYGEGYSFLNPDTGAITFTENPPVWEPTTERIPSLPTAGTTTTTTPPVLQDETKVIVKGDASAVQYTGPQGTGGVTDASFREGTGGVVLKLEEINKTLKSRLPSGGSGGGSTTEVTVNVEGVESRIDTTNTRLQTLVDEFGDEGRQGRLAEAQLDALDNNPEPGEASAAGASAKGDAEGVVTEVTGRSGYATGSQPNLTIALPPSFGGKVFDLNPFQSGRFATICAWIKGAIAWMCIIGWAIWAWGEVKENFVIGLLAPQAKGNAVLGGTGGQITALAAAAAITVALGAFFLAMLGKFTGDWSIGSIALLATSDPMIGLGAGALWMIEQIIPVATVLGTFVFRLVFKTACIKLVLGVAAVIRFIVP